MGGNNLVAQAKQLMWQQTHRNGSPAWPLTELAVKKGIVLAKKYKANPSLVAASLYLAHTVFSKMPKDKIQKNHPVLSSQYIKPYLKKWHVPVKDQAVIINAIRAHHAKEPARTIEAEVVKNAECFKFVTVPGILLELYDLGKRGLSLSETVNFIEYKIKQKMSYLTLKDCKQEANANLKKITKLLKELKVSSEF